MTKKNLKKQSPKKKSFIHTWTFKVVVISLFITALFSLLSELTVSASGAIVIVFIILIIIAVGIFFDAISTAVTSCELGSLTAMASRKVKAAKTALRLVNNADKVASFCGDIVGDILGIISGACIVALAAKAALGFNAEERLLTIIFSSITAAATIGGKSYLKRIAMKKSKEFVMFVANILYFFEKKDKKDKK
jgi:CBS domain containing-hemolysin-like protein